MLKRVIALLLALLIFSTISNTAILADTDVSPKMLYIKTNENWKELYQKAKVVAGETYYFTFSTSAKVAFRPICTSDNNRVTVNANIQLVKKQTNDGYNDYIYSYTIPAVDENGNSTTEAVFVGIAFTSPYDGYFFNASFYNANDSEKKQLFLNADFSNNLDEWAWGWDQWFGIWSQKGISEWSNSTTTLKLVDYDEKLLEEKPPEKMLHIVNESIDMNDEVLVKKIDSITADTEYTISLDRKFVSGALNDQVKIVLLGDDGNSNTMRDTIIDFSADSNYIVSSYDDGVNLKYTFKLNSTVVENHESFYAGFYFRKWASRMITEVYIADFVIYKTADTAENNLFVKKDYSDMGGWYTLWRSSADGNQVFDSQTVDTLDYRAQYVAYDAEQFKATKDTVHYGDTNFDGDINVCDLVAIKKKASEFNYYAKNFDCNSDGKLNAQDLLLARKHILEIEKIRWDSVGISLQAASKLSGGADAAAESLRNKIEQVSDTVASQRVYYVSESGKYNNSGLSSDQPITLEKLRNISLSSGDAVLFKRGDTFRISETIEVVSGVSYGAYGTGAKPVISGSLRNYADEGIWSTDDGNMWRVTVDSINAATVVFDNGEYVGFSKSSLEDVKNDGDFYFDAVNKTLYLRLGQYNPGSYFNSIEIASSSSAFSGSFKKNVTLQNLDVRHIAVHALRFVGCKEFNITGCEIGWVGGGWFSIGSYILGNAIEFWDGIQDCTIKNNHFYQVYDAAITFQGSTGNGVYKNLSFTDNLIEYCSMNFEFWDSSDMNSASNATMSNISFTDNILRFSGYGFSGLQRRDTGNQAFILAWHYIYKAENIIDFNIKNNIFDVANSYFYYASRLGNMVTVSDNTYYQNGNSPYNTVEYNTLGGVIYAKDYESFESAIKTFDSNPVVHWLDSAK